MSLNHHILVLNFDREIFFHSTYHHKNQKKEKFDKLRRFFLQNSGLFQMFRFNI